MSRNLSNENMMKTTEKIYKMTNKEDGGCNPRIAAVMAVHLVSQVLDEAYAIANAARDSGQPWQNLLTLKSFKTSRLCDMDEEDPSFEASKGDCDLNENKMEMIANIVATSTPQKLSIRVDCSDEGEASTHLNDFTFIGQGDEDLESQQNELAKSTSMFLNHLFDMSEVERIVLCDDTEVIQNTSESNELFAEAMNKIMEPYVTNTLIPLDTFPLVPTIEVIDGTVPAELSRSDSSDYSFMADAFVADINRDVAFYIDDEVSCEKHDDYAKGDHDQAAVVEEIVELVDENAENIIQRDDVVLYEDAYATLNRDYDQVSEEDGFPILQDPKGMTLQEVELMTANTSDDDLSYTEYKPEQKPKEAAPTVSGISGSRKSSIAQRCRMQGARLLACLRGWWRRKTPGKRKDSHYPGTVLGMCPLSPHARRRASSLLDNRLLRSPSPSRPIVWKFNTVNEALVNSNHWKEYTFDAKAEDCGEY